MKLGIKFFVYILLLFGFITQVYATGNILTGIDLQQEARIEILENENKLLSNKLTGFIESYSVIELQYKDVFETASAIIDKGLDRQSNILTIFSMVIAIIGLFLGRYITSLSNKVKRMGETSEKLIEVTQKELKVSDLILKKAEAKLKLIGEMSDKTEKHLEEVKHIQENIEKYPNKIYNQIKSEETKFIFNRLKDYPEDLQNFFSKLATRVLEIEYYKELRELYCNKKISKRLEIRVNYMTLMFQHFHNELFISEEEDNIWQSFIKTCSSHLRSAFSKEIEDITISISNQLISLNKDEDENIDLYKSRYREYLQSLEKGRYLSKDENKLLKQIYNIFINQGQKELLDSMANDINLDLSILENDPKPNPE